MASIKSCGATYLISASNGRDDHGKQIMEYATYVPDPNKTDRQNERALQKFAIDFEDKPKMD